MEWSILFMGPVGAGKSCAISTLSDIAVADTEARATDSTALLKQFTTVSMDVGMLDLGHGDKVHLLGAPGQDRFDFMWDILLEQAHALIILIDHSRETSLSDLDHFVNQLNQRTRGRHLPLAIGVTHMDATETHNLKNHRDRLKQAPPLFAQRVIPVFSVDAREIEDIRALVICVTALLEMKQRFGFMP